MNSNNSSGSKAWVILLAIIGGLFVGTKIFPLLSRILSLFLGIGVCLVIATIVLVIYFSCRKDQKPGGNPSQQAPPVGQGQQATREAQQGNTSQQSGNYGQQQGQYGGQNGNYGPNAGNFGQQRTAQQTAYRGTAGSSRGNVPPPQQNRGAQQGNPQQNQGPKAIPPCDLPPEVMQTLTRGRNHLTELRRILYKIANLNVKKRGEDICTEIEKILGALQQQPEDISMVRQFFNYYLPALGNILLKYLRLEEAGMATEQTTVKVMSCLGEIKTAMEKQYSAIFENDILDLTVEMEALTQACKRDGLLVSDDFTIKEGDRIITLTV